MKIMMSAYACRPHFGSEPGVGWNWAVQASKDHCIWVITNSSNRPYIEAEVRSFPNPNLHFEYHNLHGLLSLIPAHNKPGTPSAYLRYYLWQLTVIRPARGLNREHQFDLVHHITFGSFRFPSFAAFLPVPFIWGPVGGAEEAPQRVYRGSPLRYRLMEAFRSINNRMTILAPLVRVTMRRAALILAATPETQSALPTPIQAKSRVMDALGVDVTAVPIMDQVSERQGGRILCVSRLVHWKGIDLAVEAFALTVATLPNWRLTIMGTGPDEQRLKEIVEQRGITGTVEFTGFVSNEERAAALLGSDMFLLPSLHDSGGIAVLEAMSYSLPVVCMAIGGPAMTVTTNCGIMVQPRSREEIILDLAKAIVDLALDPERRVKMGERGYNRVTSEYIWPEKGVKIRAIYRSFEKVSARIQGS